MEKSLALFSAKVGVGIAQDETNGGEEITLARPITADDNIMFRGKGLNDRLVLVASKKSGEVPLLPSMTTYLLKPWIIICLTYMLRDA